MYVQPLTAMAEESLFLSLDWAEGEDAQLDLVLDLTGACLSCGAAPGTLRE